MNRCLGVPGSPSKLLAMPPYFPASSHPHPDRPPQCRAHAAGPTDQDRDFRGRRVRGEDLVDDVREVGAGAVDGDVARDPPFPSPVLAVIGSRSKVILRMFHQSRPLLEFHPFHVLLVLLASSSSSSIRSGATATGDEYPRSLPEVFHSPQGIRCRLGAPHECDLVRGDVVPLDEVAVDGESEGGADAAGDEEDGGVGVQGGEVGCGSVGAFEQEGGCCGW